MTIFDRHQLDMCRTGCIAERRKRDAQALRRYAARRRVRRSPRNPIVNRVVWIVANQYGIKVSDVLSRDRRQLVSLVRRICMYAFRQMDLSYAEIGRQMSRDHGTVMWGVNSIGFKAANSPEFSNQLDGIMKLVKQPKPFAEAA